MSDVEVRDPFGLRLWPFGHRYNYNNANNYCVNGDHSPSGD